jgi:hypothetical protein
MFVKVRYLFHHNEPEAVERELNRRLRPQDEILKKMVVDSLPKNLAELILRKLILPFQVLGKLIKKLTFSKTRQKQIQKVVKTGKKKPPRGIIVTVRDKKGREKTESSRFDFVVNTDSVKGFVADMIDRMKDDYMEWIEMNEGNENLR